MTARSTLQRAAVAVLAVGALTACTSPATEPTASPTGAPSTTVTPSPTPTPLTAAETVQEAVRLWQVKEPTGETRDALCALFTPDALRYPSDQVTPDSEGAVPMVRWCGSSGAEALFPPVGYEIADRVPTIEEQIEGPDGAQWVRVMTGGNHGYQDVAAVVDTDAGWRITGWCSFSSTGIVGSEPTHPDDPFYCLRGGQS